MGVGEIITIILGSGVVVAIVNLLSERLKRRDSVKDKRNDAAAQIEELRAETSGQFDQVDNRFRGVEKKIDTLDINTKSIMLSTKAQAYDRIRYLALAHIRAGYITPDEMENLGEMHQAYKALGGDGFLDKLMAEVGRLRIRPDDKL